MSTRKDEGVVIPAGQIDLPRPRLASLQQHDLPKWRVQAIRQAAHQELSRTSKRHRNIEKLKQLYQCALEPTFVAALAIGYLGWAFSAAMSLH